MSKYKIVIRREMDEIGISVSDNETDALIFTDAFKSDINYYKTVEFINMREKFLEFLNESDIELSNNKRTQNLFVKLLGNIGIEFESVILDEKSNRQKYMGVKKYEGLGEI